MKNNLTALFIITAAAIILAVITRTNLTLEIFPPQNQTIDQQELSDQKKLSSLTDDQANVAVEVVPKVIVGGQEAIFEVTFNTHSVDLNFDLTQVSFLINDQGEKYIPLSWTGGSGGHHLTGTLTFPQLADKTTAVELVMQNISGVDRKFSWQLTEN